MDMSSGPERWYSSLPLVTKYFITFVFIATLLISCHILSLDYFIHDWNFIYYKLQIWRILLNIFYIGKFSFSWIFFMSLFIQFSSSLEKNPVFSSPGSYLYFILIQSVLLSVISLFFFWPSGYPFLSNSLLFAIIYYWSRRETWTQVSIYFFTVKGYQLPFALIFLHIIMGHSLWVDLMGLLSGHLYFFFREILPREGGPNLLQNTPKVFDTLALKLQNLNFSQGINSVSGIYTNRSNNRINPSDSQGDRRRMFIGRGMRLGGN